MFAGTTLVPRATGSVILLSLFALLMAAACGPTAIPAEQEGEEGGSPGGRLPPSQELEYECDDVPEDGVCREGNAYFCDKRSESIEVKRCATQGLSCDDSAGYARCVDDSGVEEEVETEVDAPPSQNDTGQDCDVYDYVGDCEGNTLYYCTKENTLYVHDCSDIGGTCGFSESAGYYGCLPPPDCDTSGDTCEGNAIKTCTIGDDGWEVELWECDPDEECVEDGNYATCEPKSYPTSEPTCAELGFKGACIDDSGKVSPYQEDKLAYCAADGVTIVEEDCSLLGLTCVDPDSSGYVECGTP